MVWHLRKYRDDCAWIALWIHECGSVTKRYMRGCVHHLLRIESYGSTYPGFIGNVANVGAGCSLVQDYAAIFLSTPARGSEHEDCVWALGIKLHRGDFEYRRYAHQCGEKIEIPVYGEKPCDYGDEYPRGSTPHVCGPASSRCRIGHCRQRVRVRRSLQTR